MILLWYLFSGFLTVAGSITLAYFFFKYLAMHDDGRNPEMLLYVLIVAFVGLWLFSISFEATFWITSHKFTVFGERVSGQGNRNQVYLMFFIMPAVLLAASIKYFFEERYNKVKINIENKEKDIAIKEKNKQDMESKKIAKINLEESLHEIDKTIAKTNDEFNISMYDEFSKNFIQAWVKYKLNQLKISDMANDLHSESFNKVQAQMLIGHCELVARAVYREWYKGYNPPLTFNTINDRAKEAGGEMNRFTSLSYLENYLHALMKSLIDSIKISEEIMREFERIDYLTGKAGDYSERRSIGGNILEAKINFLLISVFFKNREGVHIKYRKEDRKKSSEGIKGLLDDIEKVKESIAQNKDFYPEIKNAFQTNDDVRKWLEEEMGRLNFSDKNYIEKCNKLKAKAKEKLNYDFI